MARGFTTIAPAGFASAIGHHCIESIGNSLPGIVARREGGIVWGM